MDRASQDNHANQMNPNNDAYWESRGLDDRPDDWEAKVEEETKAEENKQESNAK